LIKLLGEGDFGRVFMAVRRFELPAGVDLSDCSALYRSSAPKYAFKLFSSEGAMHAELLSATKLNDAQLSNVIKFRRAVSVPPSPEYASTALVYELCNAGDLQSYITQLTARGDRPSRSTTLAFAASMTDTMASLKLRGLLHRDAMPRNWMLHVDPDGRTHVKIADFGLVADIGVARSAQGGGGYGVHFAPEIERGEVHDYQADVYTLGVSLYELLCAEAFSTPDKVNSAATAADRGFMRAQLASRELYSRHRGLAVLVGEMVRDNPAERPSIEEVQRRVAEMLRKRPRRCTCFALAPRSRCSDLCLLLASLQLASCTSPACKNASRLVDAHTHAF
jgi:serine/threonine protein kinase